ncbi:hypothetical protein NL676_006381 [Syzygium grande]|nr:hypothetical protein NL676_006381 [Syzygium grande]
MKTKRRRGGSEICTLVNAEPPPPPGELQDQSPANCTWFYFGSFLEALFLRREADGRRQSPVGGQWGKRFRSRRHVSSLLGPQHLLVIAVILDYNPDARVGKRRIPTGGRRRIRTDAPPVTAAGGVPSAPSCSTREIPFLE